MTQKLCPIRLNAQKASKVVKFEPTVKLRNNHAAKHLKPWDQKLVHDPSHNAEYAEEIHIANLEKEALRFDKVYEDSHNPDSHPINQKNRILLLNFLFGIFQKEGIDDIATFFITVQLLDRYYHIDSPNSKTMQLVGC